MARTPKSERQYRRADAEFERKQAASEAERDPEPRHPTHVVAARAFDRHNAKLAHTNREYQRATGRELRADGWDTVQRLDGGWQCTGEPPWRRANPGPGQVVPACQSGRDYEKAEASWRLPARDHVQGAGR